MSFVRIRYLVRAAAATATATAASNSGGARRLNPSSSSVLSIAMRSPRSAVAFAASFRNGGALGVLMSGTRKIYGERGDPRLSSSSVALVAKRSPRPRTAAPQHKNYGGLHSLVYPDLHFSLPPRPSLLLRHQIYAPTRPRAPTPPPPSSISPPPTSSTAPRASTFRRIFLPSFWSPPSSNSPPPPPPSTSPPPPSSTPPPPLPSSAVPPPGAQFVSSAYSYMRARDWLQYRAFVFHGGWLGRLWVTFDPFAWVGRAARLLLGFFIFLCLSDLLILDGRLWSDMWSGPALALGSRLGDIILKQLEREGGKVLKKNDPRFIRANEIATQLMEPTSDVFYKGFIALKRPWTDAEVVESERQQAFSPFGSRLIICTGLLKSCKTDTDLAEALSDTIWHGVLEHNTWRGILLWIASACIRSFCPECVLDVSLDELLQFSESEKRAARFKGNITMCKTAYYSGLEWNVETKDADTSGWYEPTWSEVEQRKAGR